MGYETRKIWFITRPERDPVFHEEALNALCTATENFTLKWHGNREIHKKYEQCLIDLGVKRDSISNDGSGGRTWAALLKTFCYCYVNSKGILVPTKVGKAILSKDSIRSNINKQILTLQIPNAYFLENGFKPKFVSNFAMLPVRFLIKLCTEDELSNYLTKEEITFIVMTAQKYNELDNIVSKIVKYRKLSENEKKIYKYTISNEYDHRERSDKGARDFFKAHSDVAHTFMLISEYTDLVKYERGNNSKIYIPKEKIINTKNKIDFYDKRYPFNNKYKFSLERMAETNGLDVNSFKANPFGDIKPATNLNKKINKAEEILSQYPNASLYSYDEIADLLASQFSEKDCNKLAEHFSSYDALSILDDSFVNNILNETNDLEFEKKVAKLLMELGFKVIMHPKYPGESTEIDILVKYGNNLCGIIDAKNYKKKFSLTASLASHMISEYIPNYIEYENCDLKFFGYITSNDIGGAINLSKITTKVKQNIKKEIKGIMINVKSLLTLLDFCIENNIKKEDRISLFLNLINNNSYTSYSQVNNVIKKN